MVSCRMKNKFWKQIFARAKLYVLDVEERPLLWIGLVLCS